MKMNLIVTVMIGYYLVVMSRYQGGKNRNGREIAHVIIETTGKLQRYLKPTPRYVEPFIGMAGVFRHIAHAWPDHRLTISDRNVGVARMWQRMLERGNTNWIPTTVTLGTFTTLKKKAFADDAKAPIRGIVGHAMSFGGAYFSGYVGKYEASATRDYMRAAIHNLDGILEVLKACPKLDKVMSRSYLAYKSLVGCVVYCDPPYLRNKSCNRNPLYKNFNHAKFWTTMTLWSKQNLVFVSEEQAPDDWTSIYQFSARRTHNHHNEERNNNPDVDNTRTRYDADKVWIHKSWAARLRRL